MGLLGSLNSNGISWVCLGLSTISIDLFEALAPQTNPCYLIRYSLTTRRRFLGSLARA